METTEGEMGSCCGKYATWQTFLDRETMVGHLRLHLRMRTSSDPAESGRHE